VDNRRLLIAALLSMAVLFLWQVLFPPPEPPRAPVARPAPEALATPESPAKETQSAAREVGAEAEAEPQEVATLAAAAEERVVLETSCCAPSSPTAARSSSP